MDIYFFTETTMVVSARPARGTSCIVFEGRDGVGKGGSIKAVTERGSSRAFRVVALLAPTDREKSQMYIQRYIPHLPAAGEVVIFDRSWYSRAGVEGVMGGGGEALRPTEGTRLQGAGLPVQIGAGTALAVPITQRGVCGV